MTDNNLHAESKAVEEKVGDQPERVVRLEAIRGMESAKRLLEVALCGSHPMVLVFNSNSQAPDLIRVGRRIAGEMGIPFHGLAFPACRCGRFATASGQCRCTRSQMRRHMAKVGNRSEEFALWMDACLMTPQAIGAWQSESESDILARIARVVQSGASTAQPDSEAIELLNAWQKQACFAANAHRVVEISRTIASMDGDRDTIRARHIAEALQYQAVSVPWLWDLIAPMPVEERTPRIERS